MKLACRFLNILGAVAASTFVFAAFTLTPLTFAQGQQAPAEADDGPSNWWRIEVIMFTQGNGWSSSAEVWPTDVVLSYPDTWQTLVPLLDPNAEIQEQAGNNNNPAQNTSPENNATEQGTEIQLEELKLLPQEELQLTGISNKVNRGRRRVLFHGAWHQYMERNQEEAPIIFAVGDQYDDHYELEGSIHIYLQRLLHFDVNLWLTEFSINAGQLRQPWPELPTAPSRQIPVFDLPGAGLSDLGRPATGFNQPSFQGSNQATGANNGGNGVYAGANIGQTNTLEWFDQQGNTTFYDSRYDQILSRTYVINHLALIQQDRPMRSDELHYIDHPQLGILVKITRYQPPEPMAGTPAPRSN